MEITPEQIRAARALLGLQQAELAQRAHISVATVRRVEGESAVARVTPGTRAAVRHALERAGAEFIPNGVRRRPATRPGATSLYDELRAISLRSAARLSDRELLTENELYDADGLPA